jgi:ABC-type glycerol-3-phosphate transport system substrate-binding protein
MPPMNSTIRVLSSTGPSRRRAFAAAGLAAVVAAAIAACGGGSPSSSGSPMKDGFSQAPQTSGPLTVWVDSTRLPAAQAYQKAHPNVKLKIVTYDGDANGSNFLQTKIDLFDRTGSGWPDVVFSTQQNETTWAVSAGYAAPLNEGLIPQSTLSNFATGSLGVCTVSGKVYCLRNDLAQVVMWYNATLMKKWGYQVPATWPQYEALGQKVAKQHPGYLVGNAGDTFTPEIYMWASQCQGSDITGPRSVTVDVTSPNCTRMASLLDTLIKAGSMSKLSVFSTAFDKNEKGKVLMMPGPAWLGGAIFDSKTALNVPAGQMGVAPIPQWPGTSAPSTGNVGGGTWLLSAHTAHLKQAVNFITWVTGNNAWQDSLSPGYPAYVPAAKVWLGHQLSSGYYVGNVAAVLEQAGGEVWPGWNYGKWSNEAVWAATIDPGLTAGKTIVSMLPAWQTAITNYATSDGYTVSR